MHIFFFYHRDHRAHREGTLSYKILICSSVRSVIKKIHLEGVNDSHLEAFKVKVFPANALVTRD